MRKILDEALNNKYDIEAETAVESLVRVETNAKINWKLKLNGAECPPAPEFLDFL